MKKDLQYGIIAPDINVVRRQIKVGVDVNLPDKRGITPLMLAANLNRNIEILKALISAGANINLRDNEGNTALIHSVYGVLVSLKESIIYI